MEHCQLIMEDYLLLIREQAQHSMAKKKINKKDRGAIQKNTGWK